MDFPFDFPSNESYCISHREALPCTTCARDQERATSRIRFSAHLTHPSDARAEGFTLDRNVYPWFAYKGDRFSPDQSREVTTDYEEFLQKEVDYLEEDLEMAENEADANFMWYLIVALGLVISSFSAGAILF